MFPNAIFNTSSTNYYIKTDIDGNYTYVNDFFCKNLGLKKGEIIGKSGLTHIIPEDHEKCMQLIHKCFEKPNTFFYEILRKQHPVKGVITNEWEFVAIAENGNIQEVVCIGKDISDLKKALLEHEEYIEELHVIQEELNAVLDEKNHLFKELHHRVKNNLNMINSFLMLKSSSTSNNEVIEFAKELKGRIQSIARVHEHILIGEEGSVLYSDTYLTQILNDSVKANTISPDKYTLQIDVDKVKLDSDLVFNLGMIANEILTNIFKHAYEIEQGGQVDFQFKSEGQKGYLIIRDYGKGFQPKESSNSMGMTLIDLFVKQIKGSLEIASDGGAFFKITFPLKD